ncbi:hypothetical protein EX30DRAFT_344376 [Ascodesmis nigricans]|uniref:Uncharacterized protein n=1 Tax=Ascodesmis nigricans TaxID=341454 RepID=A0A4S2MP84_9PEZI|nr:hypothetical protein EX30DRAFT_344376 [Ascodesmis nigricans]
MPSVYSTLIPPFHLLASLVSAVPLGTVINPIARDSRTVFFIAVPQEWKTSITSQYPYFGHQAEWLHISRDFGNAGMRRVGVSNAADGWKPLAFSSNLAGHFGETLGVKVTLGRV